MKFTIDSSDFADNAIDLGIMLHVLLGISDVARFEPTGPEWVRHDIAPADLQTAIGDEEGATVRCWTNTRFGLEVATCVCDDITLVIRAKGEFALSNPNGGNETEWSYDPSLVGVRD